MSRRKLTLSSDGTYSECSELDGFQMGEHVVRAGSVDDRDFDGQIGVRQVAWVKVDVRKQKMGLSDQENARLLKVDLAWSPSMVWDMVKEQESVNVLSFLVVKRSGLVIMLQGWSDALGSWKNASKDGSMAIESGDEIIFVVQMKSCT